MKRLIAGKSFWLVSEKSEILRYCIVDSKYTTEGGIELKARGVDGIEKISINRCGVVETDNRYDYTRPISEPPQVTWMRVFWSRRRAERALKEGRGVRSFPACEQSGMYAAAKNLGWGLNLIPFRRLDVCARAAKLIDELFKNAPEPSARPETIRFVRYDDRELITRVPVGQEGE